jgi:hypothetical protein
MAVFSTVPLIERDFSNSAWVKLEVAAEIGIRPEQLEIRRIAFVEPSMYSGTVYGVSTISGYSDWVWNVVRDHDELRKLGLGWATYLFRKEPRDAIGRLSKLRAFNSSAFREAFVRFAVDQDALRDGLEGFLTQESAWLARGLARSDPEEFWNVWDRVAEQATWFPRGMEASFRARRTPNADERDALADALAEDAMLDPVGYLKGTAPRRELAARRQRQEIPFSDAMSEVARFGGIDAGGAAALVVERLGPLALMSVGEKHARETPSGYVYWQET